MTLTFTVPIAPVPKARARTVRTKAGKTRTFTPARTEAYERAVMCFATQAKAAHSPRWLLLDGDRYGLHVDVYRGADRGDWDNFGKAVSDSLNGVLWRDDSQVHDARVRLFVDRGNPRAEVRVWRLEGA